MDSAGRPISEGGIFCMVTATRLHPGLTFAQVAAKYKSPPNDEKGSLQSFDRAKAHLIDEHQRIQAASQSSLPTWIPASSCSRQDNYGHELYQKAAALTESEVQRIFKKSPQQLKLTMWEGHLKSPKESTKYFLVSLESMPEEIKASCRKVKVFWRSGCLLDELWLRPDVQLSKEQATPVFHYINDQKYNSRPPRILTQSLPTFDELMAEADRLSNVLEETMVAKPDEDESEDDGKADAVQSTAMTMLDLEGLGDGVLSSTTVRKRKTPAANTASAKAGAAAAAITAQFLASSTRSAKQVPEDASSKKGRKDGAHEEVISALDPDLKKVARMHLSTGTGTSVKCLKELNAKAYLLQGSDHHKGSTIPSVGC